MSKRKGTAWAEVVKVDLTGACPPIERMDASLSCLSSCRHLALSTNNIDKIGSLAGLGSLEILSLGRNCIKKLENLEGVAGTLQELWISYNSIEKLVSPVVGLHVSRGTTPSLSDFGPGGRTY